MALNWSCAVRHGSNFQYAIFVVYRQEIPCHWTTNVLLFAVIGKEMRLFLLFPGLASASLTAVIRAVFVEGNLDIGLYECAFVGQTEAEVLDRDSAVTPHLFVVSLDAASFFASVWLLLPLRRVREGLIQVSCATFGDEVVGL